jgi:3-phenylpropionate/trans-cinnamate dioxygenase ferredoxin subunit
MGRFVRVARVDDIPEGQVREYEVADMSIVICHAGSGFYALADECSHDSAPFGDGRLVGHELVCPRHGATFDVRSGAVSSPPAVVGIDRFELKVEGEDIYVLVD